MSELIIFDEDVSGVDDVPALVANSAVVYGNADGLPHSFGGLTPASDGTLYMVGGSPDTPSGVYSWKGLRQAPGATPAVQAELLACSSSSSVPDGYISMPKPVAFPSVMGESYGYYHPPTHLTGRRTRPRMLVKAHGGQRPARALANPGIQFFTSRGFAVLDVDYGGSTGYGRAHGRPRGNWGIVDIDDAAQAHSTSSIRASPTRSASPSTAARPAATRRWGRSLFATSSPRDARCTASPTSPPSRPTRTSSRAGTSTG